MRIPTISELNETWLSVDGLTERTIVNTAKVMKRNTNPTPYIVAVFMIRFCLQFLVEQGMISSVAPTYSKYVNRSY